MTDLDGVLADHAAWAAGRGGKRANLTGANLRRVDLSGVDLRGAILSDDARIVQVAGDPPSNRGD